MKCTIHGIVKSVKPWIEFKSSSVLLRTIDVIMGRQKLGNPKEEGGAK